MKLNFPLMNFLEVQEKFEESRKEWASRGRLIDYWRFVFWDWRYKRQKVPQK